MIARVLESEFSDAESGFFGNDIERVSENYAGEGETFFVATDGNRIVGTAGIKREDDRQAMLRRIFVDPDYRKRRIGSQLIDKAVSFCKGQGYDEIIFKTTSRMSDAIRMCEANGFTKRAQIELAGLDLLKFTLYLPDYTNGES